MMDEMTFIIYSIKNRYLICKEYFPELQAESGNKIKSPNFYRKSYF